MHRLIARLLKTSDIPDRVFSEFRVCAGCRCGSSRARWPLRRAELRCRVALFKIMMARRGISGDRNSGTEDPLRIPSETV